MDNFYIKSEDREIEGTIDGTDEMFDVNEFYQIFTTADGKKYRAYYLEEDQPEAINDDGQMQLDCIDYSTISYLSEAIES